MTDHTPTNPTSETATTLSQWIGTVLTYGLFAIAG
jgi:hypothetical protein